jgi:hypothetical protein
LDNGDGWGESQLAEFNSDEKDWIAAGDRYVPVTNGPVIGGLLF